MIRLRACDSCARSAHPACIRRAACPAEMDSSSSPPARRARRLPHCLSVARCHCHARKATSPSHCRHADTADGRAVAYAAVAATVSNLSTHRAKMAEGVSSARAAGLRYANADAPGITRKRRGKGFVYLDRARPTDPRREDARAHSRAGAAAGVDRRLDLDRRARASAGHRPRRRRPQAVSLSRRCGRAERDSTKYHRMLAFAEVLPAIRRRTRRDLMGPACCRPRVLATVVELLARTYIRIGNEEYARKQQVARLDDAAGSARQDSRPQAALSRFAARAACSSRSRSKSRGSRIAVRQCQDLPGQTLFQYLDDDKQAAQPVVVRHQRLPAGSHRRQVHRQGFPDVGRHAVGGAGARRRWSRRHRRRRRTSRSSQAVDQVAEALGNTRAVCRKCYIHPGGARRVHRRRHAEPRDDQQGARAEGLARRGSAAGRAATPPRPGPQGGLTAVCFRSTHHRHAP